MSAAQILPFLKNLLQQPQAMPAAMLPNAEPAAPNLNGAPPQPAQPYDPGPDTIAQLDQSPSQNPTLAPESKGHKLLRLLPGILQGGLDGIAANAQTYAQTGRNAGFGGGLAGATQLPFQRAFQRGELAQQKAQTAVTQQQAQEINVPGYGSMPAGLARVLFPSLIKGQSAEKVQQMKGQTAENVANINKRYMAVPNVGLYDTQTRALVPGTQNGIMITPDIAKDYQLPADFIGKPMNVAQLSQLERAQNQQEATVQGQNGPALVNKKTKQVTNLGLGNPGMGKPMEVGDPNNPGQTLITTGGAAQGMAGKGSASVKVATKAAEGEVPSKIGDQKLAFNTAIQHANLLRQAVKALGNGDQQTLNGLKNSFKNAFGEAGPITAQAISDAYQREVTAMLSKGHMTDSEVNSVGKTLNPNKQNYSQIDSVIGAYQALAQSKMQQLDRQKQAAIQQSQPKAAVKLGQTVNIGGKELKVTSVHADGSFDAQ